MSEITTHDSELNPNRHLKEEEFAPIEELTHVKKGYFEKNGLKILKYIIKHYKKYAPINA